MKTLFTSLLIFLSMSSTHAGDPANDPVVKNLVDRFEKGVSPSVAYLAENKFNCVYLNATGTGTQVVRNAITNLNFEEVDILLFPKYNAYHLAYGLDVTELHDTGHELFGKIHHFAEIDKKWAHTLVKFRVDEREIMIGKKLRATDGNDNTGSLIAVYLCLPKDN